MPYEAKAIANAFLELAKRKGADLSPLKLQSLVYYAHGWHLTLRGEPLIDEPIMARSYGPIIESLRHEFQEFGNDPIVRPALEWAVNGDRPRRYAPSIENNHQSDIASTRSLINKIWEVYGDFSAVKLSNMTHVMGSPWRRIFEEYEGEIPEGTAIDPDLIRDYFEGVRKVRQ